MTFLILVASVVLAVLGAVTVATSAAVTVTVRWRQDGTWSEPLLLALRLLPVATGLAAAAGLALPALVAFEPAQAERPGVILGLLAGLGSLILARSAWLLARSIGSTRDLVRRFATGEPLALASPLPAFRVETSFPLVAVAGIREPRLLVARQVEQALGDAELDAVVQHELAHWRRRDNLTALVLRATPDPLGRFGAGARLETAWREAAELASDAEAVSRGGASSVDLASALVKVARLASRGETLELPIAALHSGAPLEARVGALLAGTPGPTASCPVAVLGAVIATVAALALDPQVLQGVHRALETVVRTLP